VTVMGLSPLAGTPAEPSMNQEVAGSSPARGANNSNDFCSAPSTVTGSCVAQDRNPTDGVYRQADRNPLERFRLKYLSTDRRVVLPG